MVPGGQMADPPSHQPWGRQGKSDLEAGDQMENITQVFPTGRDAYSWPRSGKVHPRRF